MEILVWIETDELFIEFKFKASNHLRQNSS